MRTNSFIAIIAAILLTACSGKKTMDVETFSYSDSCDYAYIAIEGELPTVKDEITQAIRDTLLYILENELTIPDYDGNGIVDKYKGDRSDLKKIIDYYGTELSGTLTDMCKTDVDDRNASINENDMLSEKEKQDMLSDIPTWEYSLSLRTDTVTSNYAIFQCNSYIYQGGAHGGVSGAGAITFDMRTGKRFTNFINRDNTHRLQELLRKGLVSYFNECGDEVTDENLNDYIMVSRDIVPLPYQYVPFPGQDGLVFTYAQYEIASYAAGMPSFVIPYPDIEPYLTDEAKELLADELDR